MIHTVDVRITLTESAYRHILREYGEPAGLQRYLINDFADDGLTEIKLYQFFSNRTTKYYMRVTMNPQHVLTGQYDPLALFDEDNYIAMSEKFDQLISSVSSLTLKPLSQWTASRIDYAYDIKLIPGSDTGTATKYLEMGKRGLLPQCSVLKENDGWVSYRAENNSVTVNYYEREAALQSRDYEFNDTVYQKARDILRFEVQCLTPKLKTLAGSSGISGRPIGFYMNRDLWRKIISGYGQRIVGTQDYYSVLYASLTLRKCRVLRADAIKNLLDFLKAVDVAGGINEATAIWKQNKPVHIHWTKEDKDICLTDSQRQSRMRQLRRLGINPVPIPVHMKKSRLVNPLQIFWNQAAPIVQKNNSLLLLLP